LRFKYCSAPCGSEGLSEERKVSVLLSGPCAPGGHGNNFRASEAAYSTRFRRRFCLSSTVGLLVLLATVYTSSENRRSFFFSGRQRPGCYDEKLDTSVIPGLIFVIRVIGLCRTKQPLARVTLPQWQTMSRRSQPKHPHDPDCWCWIVPERRKTSEFLFFYDDFGGSKPSLPLSPPIRVVPNDYIRTTPYEAGKTSVPFFAVFDRWSGQGQ